MFEPMRNAAYFALLAATLMASACWLIAQGLVGPAWILAVAETYSAICLFAMAIAYGLNDCGVAVEGLFRHRRLTWGIDLLILPYRLLARVTCGLLSRYDSMEMMHPVAHRLYVGRLPHPADHAALKQANISSVLNLCLEFPQTSKLDRAEGIETLYLPLLDGTAPSQRMFEAAVGWVVARHREGHSVLIHCAQGRGRSVTVAAAALCRLGLADTPEDALAQIRAVRPKAKPSRKQVLALSRFAAMPSAI